MDHKEPNEPGRADDMCTEVEASGPIAQSVASRESTEEEPSVPKPDWRTQAGKVCGIALAVCVVIGAFVDGIAGVAEVTAAALINVIAWTLPCALLAAIVKLVTKQAWKTALSKGSYVALIIATVATVQYTVRLIGREGNASESSSTSDGDELDWRGKQELREIIAATLQTPSEMPRLKTRFWSILSRHAGSEEEAIRFLGLQEKVCLAPKLFWEDALYTVSRGYAFKSSEREQLEDGLVEQGFMTDFQRRQNEETMEKIAEGDPVPLPDGTEMVVTRAVVEQILDAYDVKYDALRQLFIPPE